MDESSLRRIWSVFRAEAAENLDRLLELVQSMPSADLQLLRRQAEAAMGIAHSLKGAAATVGAEQVAALAHAVEDALQRAIASGLEAPPTDLIIALRDSVLAMQRHADGKEEDSSEVLGRLWAWRDTGRPGVDPLSDGRASPARTESPSRCETALESNPCPPGIGGGDAVRVESGRLDAAFGYAQDLVTTRTRLGERLARAERILETVQLGLGELPRSARGVWANVAAELSELCGDQRRDLAAFRRASTELGDALRRMRMVPIARAVAGWRRTVMEAARSSGKDAELLADVGQIELDKATLDEVRDPVMHLLRNAVSHGIEPADRRAALGKPRRGRIYVRARLRGPAIRIQIGDDGAGIDVEQLRQAALSSGAKSAEQLESMDETEALMLVFHPGLSTAAALSRLSGRGVGMDIVRRTVSQLGGSTDVVARGRWGGATFELSLPVNVLSSRGLFVETSGAVFVLPIEAVERVSLVEAENAAVHEGGHVVHGLGAEPIRLRWLSALMGRSWKQAAGLLEVVVVARGVSRLALVVDRVQREREFILKRLPWNLKSVPAVAGTTVLADGELAAVVDIAHLFEAAGRAAPTSDPSGERASRRILLADDSPAVREVQSAALRRAGYQVVAVADGREAWAALAREPFDLLVTDVQMPGIDGYKLTRLVRADARLRRLPVVLLTSLGSSDQVELGKETGATAHVVKGPGDQATLLNVAARFT